MATTIDDYIDSLSEEEFDDLSDFLAKGVNKQSDKIDSILDDAPKTEQLRLYKYYKKDDQFEDGGVLTDPGYLLAGTEEPPKKDGSAIFEINIPANKLKALQLNGTAYLLPQGLTLYFLPKQNGVVPATISDAFGVKSTSPTSNTTLSYTEKQNNNSLTVFFNGGPIPSTDDFCVECGLVTEEFYNDCHGVGGRFCGGGGTHASRSRGGGAPRPPQGGITGDRGPGKQPFAKKTKLQKIASLARDVTAVLAVATVGIALYGFAQRQKEKGGFVPPHRTNKTGVEGKRELNKFKQDQVIIGWLAKNSKKPKGRSDSEPSLPRGWRYDNGRPVRDTSKPSARETLGQVNRVG